MSSPIRPSERSSVAEERAFTFQERVGYLKKFGAHSQSFSTLQPDMDYFDVPGVGYIGFMRKWGMPFVLSDPVAAPEHFDLMLERFHQRYPNASYVQVSEPVAEVLHDRFGLYGTQCGSESRIPLQSWSISGKKKQVIRTALNQAEKNNITVEERSSDDNAREISQAWIDTRKCKGNEIRFLVRPMEMDYQENVRRFYAYREGTAIGFIYFDPMYRNNRIISYVPNVSRANADFRQGLFYPLMVRAIDVFKEEGLPYLHLGVSPMSLDAGTERQESGLLRGLFRTFYEHGSFLYNFEGQ